MLMKDGSGDSGEMRKDITSRCGIFPSLYVDSRCQSNQEFVKIPRFTLNRVPYWPSGESKLILFDPT